MSDVFATCKVVRDQLLDIGLPVYILSAPQDNNDKVVINYNPVTVNQISSEITVNVNLMINRLGGFMDIRRMTTFQNSIEESLNSYNDDTERKNFCFFRFEVPPTAFAEFEGTNFAYMNNQVTVIYNTKRDGSN